MTRRFTRLTRPAIRKLKSGESVTEHGITAECLADGDIRYSVNIMVDGQRIHRVIGRESEGVTRTQAEDFVEQARTKAREGRLSLPSRRKTFLGFGQAADLYICKLEDAGGRNIKQKRSHLTNHLVPFFGAHRLDKISEFTVGQYKARRRKADAANGTINRELSTLKHMLRRAAEWGWIRNVPCKIEKEYEGGGRLTALTDSQADALLRAAVDDADSYCWLFIAFGLNTAMRHTEMLRARFDQVDFDNLRLYIPQAKSGARVQPITPELAEILAKEREMSSDCDGWVFPTPRPNACKTGHRHRMDKPFARAAKAAGLDPALVTPHVMRHTAITKLVKAGVDIPTIQEISGHKTMAMVRRYTHVHGAHIDNAIRVIGRGMPEPNQNNSGDTVTHKLHTTPVRR